ncbi:MAG: hypothetical protein ACR2IV_20235, partial [Bryobacteraceae bacterium]
AVLIVSLAGPLHKHDSGQDANCLLCHVGERANVVAIANDAGKPLNASSDGLRFSFKPPAIFEIPDLTRTPRAPPSPLQLL